MQTRQTTWSWPTRLLHFLLAMAVLHQVLISLIMTTPKQDRPGDTYFEFHEIVGLSTFAIVTAYWLWLGSRRSDRGAGALFPWFSRAGRAAVLADARVHLVGIARLELPALEERPLASAVHGLGLLTASAMAATGMLAWLGMFTKNATELLWEMHGTLGNLMWAYLIAHVGLALIHEIAGEKILRRMFALGPRD